MAGDDTARGVVAGDSPPRVTAGLGPPTHDLDGPGMGKVVCGRAKLDHGTRGCALIIGVRCRHETCKKQTFRIAVDPERPRHERTRAVSFASAHKYRSNSLSDRMFHRSGDSTRADHAPGAPLAEPPRHPICSVETQQKDRRMTGTALVVGASGIVGNNLARHLAG